MIVFIIEDSFPSLGMKESIMCNEIYIQKTLMNASLDYVGMSSVLRLKVTGVELCSRMTPSLPGKRKTSNCSAVCNYCIFRSMNQGDLEKKAPKCQGRLYGQNGIGPVS